MSGFFFLLVVIFSLYVDFRWRWRVVRRECVFVCRRPFSASVVVVVAVTEWCVMCLIGASRITEPNRVELKTLPYAEQSRSLGSIVCNTKCRHNHSHHGSAKDQRTAAEKPEEKALRPRNHKEKQRRICFCVQTAFCLYIFHVWSCCIGSWHAITRHKTIPSLALPWNCFFSLPVISDCLPEYYICLFVHSLARLTTSTRSLNTMIASTVVVFVQH